MKKCALSLLILPIVLGLLCAGLVNASEELVLLETISVEEEEGFTSRENAFILNRGLESQILSNDGQICPCWVPIPPEERIRLNVRHYFQNKQVWSNDIMLSAGKSIGGYGCCLTSVAMVTNHYGSQDNPRQVNKKLGNSACSLNWPTVTSKYGLSYTNLSISAGIGESRGKAYILGALRMNRPVIVCLKKASGSTHFVVVYGYMRARYDANSPVQEFFYIHDPSATKDYKYLDDYLHNASTPMTFRSMKAFYRP